MVERNELAVFGQLVTGFFAKFAQRNLFHRLSCGAGVSAPGYRVDLAGGHFPDRLADRDAFLANEDNFVVACHRSDNDGCFAMDDCPRARLASRWCSDEIGDDFEMRVGKVPLARDGFPRALLHAERL